MASPSRHTLLPAALLTLVAVAMRIHNAVRYPADWGYDATFNWQYIYALTNDWSLPDPSAGWATGDPPFFYYVSALVMRGLRAVGAIDATVLVLPLLSALEGLAIAALAVLLVRRADPGNTRRAWLAGGLLLFLPAHIHMSAMVNEGNLVALLTSLAVFGLAQPGLTTAGGRGLRRAVGVGLAAGLALLTQLAGALAIATAAASYAIDGWRRRTLRGAALRVTVVALVAGAVGGWYYLRNRIEYGYFQPFGLPAHQIMFSMPPGERSWTDYLQVPLATWTDPRLLNPDLLHSVWGSTYTTIWFDGQRVFLPSEGDAVSRLGTATLLLALLPTLAFAVGLAGGVRRTLRSVDAIDLPLLLLVGLTLAGYAFYTWRNPWFAVIKGTSLLGLCLPFAFYASEVLARWTGDRGRRSLLVWSVLAALAVLVSLSCTFNLLFERSEVSGLDWPGRVVP